MMEKSTFGKGWSKNTNFFLLFYGANMNLILIQTIKNGNLK